MAQLTDVNQLVILGNGFDLASGLNSTYDNFINYILKENNLTSAEIVTMFDYKTNGELFGSNALKLNIWYLLFFYSKLSKDVTWREVERQILKWIKLLNNKRTTSKISLVKDIMLKTDKQTLSINSEPIPWIMWYKMKETSEFQSCENISDYLFQELNKLEKKFETFLFEEAGYSRNFDYFDCSQDILKQILEHGGFNDRYNIMSFNYTDPWNDRWEEMFGPLKIIMPENNSMVHGVAFRNKDDLKRIIFGIDDEGVASGSSEYKFTKVYRTLFMNSDTRINERYKPGRIFNSSLKAIKFYGHSLGEADYGYFQQMFDYLDLYENNDLKLFFYFSNWKDSGKTDEELLQEQIFSVSKLIEKYGNTMDNKHHGNNLLTRLIQNKRIIIKKLDVKN